MELNETILRSVNCGEHRGSGIYRVMSDGVTVIGKDSYKMLWRCSDESEYKLCKTDYITEMNVREGSLVYIHEIYKMYGRVLYKVIVIETQIMCGCEEEYVESGEYFADDTMLFGGNMFQLILK